jgi:hypothetical protein
VWNSVGEILKVPSFHWMFTGFSFFSLNVHWVCFLFIECSLSVRYFHWVFTWCSFFSLDVHWMFLLFNECSLNVPSVY